MLAGIDAVSAGPVYDGVLAAYVSAVALSPELASPLIDDDELR